MRRRVKETESQNETGRPGEKKEFSKQKGWQIGRQDDQR